MSNKKVTNKMWGGRFKEKSLPLMLEINSSIDIDKRLALIDIKGSRAHAKMLAKTKILKQQTKRKILSGLNQIEKEILSGNFIYRVSGGGEGWGRRKRRRKSQTDLVKSPAHVLVGRDGGGVRNEVRVEEGK